MEPWAVQWQAQARRELRRLDQPMQQQIVRAVDRLAAEGRGDVTRLTATDPEWRLRVGDWRVRFVFDYANRTLMILHVLPRGSAYD
ncbi:MAG: type II toxin-antitoxin system RelE/ParE family toxin [Chloroflexi bacterium]|nr:type II toxin-antitoxin system RelE/ParE family toxin [Chloroflexota bacterium]